MKIQDYQYPINSTLKRFRNWVTGNSRKENRADERPQPAQKNESADEARRDENAPA